MRISKNRQLRKLGVGTLYNYNFIYPRVDEAV